MINVTTKTIRQLSFSLFGKSAIFILSDYLDSNFQKTSIEQQIAPLTKFLRFIHENKNDVFSNATVNEYIDLLFTKTYSTAYMTKGFVRQFLRFLSKNGYCEEIFLNETQKQTTKENTVSVKNKKTYRYYEVFDISFNASEKEIKKAFHKLALKYHPDLNKEENSSKQFLAISHIYNVLIDENLRMEYDITMGYIDGESNKKKTDYYVVF